MNCFKQRILRAGWACAFVALACSTPVNAGSHSWDFVEVFSTADGSIQFIELMETNGFNNETGLAGKKIISAATGNEFTFPANLVPPTADKHLLLATESFAALPGAPTPDYIIVNGFFDPNGDTLDYHVYDTFSFGKGQVPTDCINSLFRDGTNGVNTPTNYQDQTGTVDACPCPWDLDGGGDVSLSDLLSLLANWGPCEGCPADFDDDGTVGLSDLLALLANWGPCP